MKYYSLFLYLLTSFSFYAQEEKDSLEVFQTLVYEIKENEKIIFQNEARLFLNAKFNGHILFVERYEEGDTNHYMIQNGVESGPYDEIFDPEIYSNYHQNEFYHFIFHQDNKKFVNMNGQVYGPYDKIGPRGGWYHLLINNEKSFAFTFVRDGKEGVNISGKEYGEYDKVYNYYTTYNRDMGITEKGKFHFRYEKNGKQYFNVNGVDYGPYDGFDPYKQFQSFNDLDNDFFAFSYIDRGETFVCWNGDSLGPFLSVRSFAGNDYSGIIQKNAMAMECETADGKFLYIKGEMIGPVEEVRGLINFNGPFAYKKDGQWTVRNSMMHAGPYEKLHAFVTTGGNLQMIYEEKNGNCHWYNDGRVTGPYKNVSYVPSGSGINCFVYKAPSGGVNFYAHRKIYGPYQEIFTGYGDIQTDRNKNFAFWCKQEHLDGYYLNVNGDMYGPYDDRKTKVMFFDKEYRLLETRDDGDYVNVSGKWYGPYEDVQPYQYQTKVKSSTEFFITSKHVDDANEGEDWDAASSRSTIILNGKKKFGPYDYVRPGYNEAGQFKMTAELDKQYYIYDGKKMRGPYRQTKYLNPDKNLDYQFFADGAMTKVIGGKKVKLDSLPPEDWMKISNEEGDTALYYSQEEDYFEFEGEVVRGYCKNSFDWHYANDRQMFYWLTLNDRKLYFNLVFTGKEED